MIRVRSPQSVMIGQKGNPQTQRKILAGQAGGSTPFFLCMIQQLVATVKARSYPDNSFLGLDGTDGRAGLLRRKHSDDVAITYHDTHDAAYPYRGMREQ
mmetsp:Transcript_41470/g.46224  ORF Transcript_41470/g.46224 Transcript_41470/m.46224 type:complete len:99 (+) Transcript_41470:54-350(+)